MRGSYMNDTKWWHAVLTRDKRLDGSFVYAVRSTGIYCRPSCPSRRPRREQVIFFIRPEDAEQAGFRQCQRCQPRAIDAAAELTQRICRYIETHLEQQVTLATLSAYFSVSPYHLQRLFKRMMGITPRQYADACRMNRFKAQLKEGEPVTRALYEAGYSSSSRLYERAPVQLGMTPTIYQKGGKGMSIRYTIVDSPLGRLLVAATERGICMVSLGDADTPLEESLQREYPAAQIQRDEVGLGQWVSDLLSYLQGQQRQLDLPLDVQATAFQWQVWQALRAIPLGETRSYREIAQALGRPKAVRAVAHACATNPAALVIPCHRVVREDGSLGGYRWGLARKHQLLEQEKKYSQPAAAGDQEAQVASHGDQRANAC